MGMNCEECRAPLGVSSRTRAQYCSRRCAIRASVRRSRAEGTTEKDCLICGVKFPAIYDARTCGDGCRQRLAARARAKRPDATHTVLRQKSRYYAWVQPTDKPEPPWGWELERQRVAMQGDGVPVKGAA